MGQLGRGLLGTESVECLGALPLLTLETKFIPSSLIASKCTHFEIQMPCIGRYKQDITALDFPFMLWTLIDT